MHSDKLAFEHFGNEQWMNDDELYLKWIPQSS